MDNPSSRNDETQEGIDSQLPPTLSPGVADLSESRESELGSTSDQQNESRSSSGQAEEGKSRVGFVVDSLNDFINYFVPPVHIEVDANQNLDGAEPKPSKIEKTKLKEEKAASSAGNSSKVNNPQALIAENVNQSIHSTPAPSHAKSRIPTRKSSMKQLISPFQRKPTHDQVLNYIKIYSQIFGNLRGRDVISCRCVCQNWYTFSTPTFRQSTAFVFNPNLEGPETAAAALLKPWLLFQPKAHSGSDFVDYIRTSLNKLNIWSTLVIRNATTADIQLILSSWNEGFLQDLFKGVTTLDLTCCCVEWHTLIRFLTYFKGLETLIDTKGAYFQTVPLTQQLIQTLTGGTESPRTRNMEISQDFIREFRRYSVKFKKLRIEDTGLGMNTGILLALLRESLAPNSLEEIEVTPGPEKTEESADRKNVKEFTMFWISLAETLLHSRDSLQKLAIRCTNDDAPRKSFDHFVLSCVEYFNRAKGQFNLTALKHLILDFNFLWLSLDSIEREFLPFIQNLPALQYLHLRTIVMRPSSDDRLHMLFDAMLKGIPDPVTPEVIHLVHPAVIDLGLHLTDLEGQEVIPEISIRMQDPMYQEVRALAISVHSRRTKELREFWMSDERLTFPKMASLSIAIMNPHFLNLNLEPLVKKFNALSELTIVDGPRLNSIGGHMAVRPENLYSHMSQLQIGNREFQLLMESYPTLRHLTLQVNMSTLTDGGVTGISQSSINRLTHHQDFLLHEPEYEITGHAIGEMSQLETLVLRGLGEWISDISVVFGFEKIPKLETLILYGKQRISKPVRQHLFARGRTNACFVKIYS